LVADRPVWSKTGGAYRNPDRRHPIPDRIIVFFSGARDAANQGGCDLRHLSVPDCRFGKRRQRGGGGGDWISGELYGRHGGRAAVRDNGTVFNLREM
jgi:hypothetical protein